MPPLYVFPRLLRPDSNVLFRVQFLTAYHASAALRRCCTKTPVWLPHSAGTEFEIPTLRNVLAHYELRDLSRFAVGATEPLLAVAVGVSGVPAEQLRAAVIDRLRRISEFLTADLTKAQLRPFGALLGSHS